MDDVSLQKLKDEGFIQDQKSAGTYNSDPTQPIANVKSVQARIILQESDIKTQGNDIATFTLEQSLDGGKTFQALSSCTGWQSGPRETSRQVISGYETQTIEVQVDPPSPENPKGGTKTKMVDIKVPIYKTITNLTNPDDFSKDALADPSIFVMFGNDGTKDKELLKSERVFRVSYNIPQPLLVGIKWDIQQWP